MDKIRVRFAPSPTGALHIGGVRTALFNYLFAQQAKGDFILRIEDTDQSRYVKEAEAYILDALDWLGLTRDEGPGIGGPKGPYKQSERKDIYRQYAEQLVNDGHAYYAFDTAEQLERARLESKELGDPYFKYDYKSRDRMNNSLGMTQDEIKLKIESKQQYTIRLKIKPGDQVRFNDLIRGEVTFATEELDDKVILKSDGMPTYHLANIVDDKLMDISHVIRGEEWLSSTAHHVLLYTYLGWFDKMPIFVHLPLILKPVGNGKLSKRDGQKLGIPVFPMDWISGEDHFKGFKELGFVAEAVINFLALLGWNPGGEKELFDLSELIDRFSFEQVSKAGARFDFEKAKWVNQQYIKTRQKDLYIKELSEFIDDDIVNSFGTEYLRKLMLLFQDRIQLYSDFEEQAIYMLSETYPLNDKMVKKKFKAEHSGFFHSLLDALEEIEEFKAEVIKEKVEGRMEAEGLNYGKVLPVLRLAVTGTSGGPDVFSMIELLGKEKTVARYKNAMTTFEDMIKS